MFKGRQPFSDVSPRISILFIAMAILLWAFMFRHYFMGHLILSGDAIAYFEHVKFFVDQIMLGQYPFWDPSRETGVPNDFFLRRIGQFNPMFLMIVFLRIAGIPHVQAYLIFLGSYFILGMLGYFLLVKHLLRNSIASYAGFLLLLFSSFTSILFKSFLVFLFTPMIWCVYFFIKFNDSREKKFFVGVVFTLMIIVSTYLPFYFLTIGSVFLISGLLVYSKQLKEAIFNFFGFIRQNKILTLLALIAMAISIYPGFLMYQELKRGDLVLPTRQIMGVENSLQVEEQTLAVGGVAIDNVFKLILPDLGNFALGKFYLPIFGFICLGYLFVTSINRFTVYLMISGILFILLTLYDATPVYPFLYKHIFYFKYFRNFQFILWIVLFPVLALLCAEQFNRCLERFSKGKSFSASLFYGVLLVMISFPSIFLFQKAEQFATRQKGSYLYRYVNSDYLKLNLPDKNEVLTSNPEDWADSKFDEQIEKEYPVTEYLCTRHSYQLWKKFNPRIIKSYLDFKFTAYDKAPDVDDLTQTDQSSFITKENKDFKILDFNSNAVKIGINFPIDKFLVYNDSYYSGWHAFLDKKEVPIIRSDVAFKGIFVPKGNHELTFQFRSPADYWLAYATHMVFIGMFVYMMFLFVHQNSKNIEV